jgi:hypothetical protein
MKRSLSSLILMACLFLCVGMMVAQAATKFSNDYKWPFGKRNIGAELGGTVAVMELFTSETCAFCPDADKYFTDLVTKTPIIGLSCHVNFFTNKAQGLSLPICTARQKQYANLISGGTKYTPQIVINGRKESIGYYYDAIMKLIIDDSKAKPIKRITIKKTSEIGSYEFLLSANNAVKSADIWFAYYAPTMTRKMTYGPNIGKTLTYSKPVTSMQKMGSWLGDTRNYKFTPSLKSNPAGLVILVQNNAGILYAGEVKF